MIRGFGERWVRNPKRRAIVLGCALGALLFAACSGKKAPTTAATAPTTRETVASGVQSAPPAEITGMELREGAPGLRLDVSASNALVWTSYRDADGGLVVDLPNTVPVASLASLAPATGLIAAVDVQQLKDGDRPLTRLTIRGRDQFEYSLSSDDKVMQLRLLPSGERQAAAAPAAAEPLPLEPAPAPPAVAAAPASVPAASAAAQAAAGTPERPTTGPAPHGVAATHLDRVEVVAADGSTTIDITGNGEFSYSTFRLENPERLVLDLAGVINSATQPTVAVGSALVDRVRVAQFKPRPDPVSRVVFDLKQASTPTIERTAHGLRLSFGTASQVAQAAPLAAPTAAPATSSTTLAEDLHHAPVTVATAEPAATTAAAVPMPEIRVPQQPAAKAPKSSATSDVALFEAAEVTTPPAPSAPAPMPRPLSGALTLGGGGKTYSGEPISLSLKDADVRDVIRSFAQISNLNIITQPNVHGSVTVELEGVPWDQALEQILKINKLGMQLDGNILRIAPTSDLREEAEEQEKLQAAQSLSVPLQTVIKHLSYSTASDVAGILRTRGSKGVGGSLMSERGTISIDQRTNTLIIKELPRYMDTVIAVIDNLDTPEPQVMIEAKIVETTKKFNRSVGIQWGFNGLADAQHGNTTGLVFPNNVNGSGSVNLLTGGNNGLLNLSLGNVLNTFKINAQLQAAEAEGLVNVLSAPKIATLNNEQAEIQSGLQIPIQTVSNNTVTVQFVNATLRLAVTPHVTAEGTVLMEIEVQKREPQLAFAITGATNAPIDTKEARTRVIVRDGGTTVIGGIYKVSTDQGEDRVPGIANIPILGSLFKNKRRTDSNEELLIFITPRVIRL
ncbi:MAG: type IV pilus secretin PilQ [Acidobacteriota bacterium]